MNNFKNLPSDVLNNIFEYYNPYKTAFTNNIIKKNVLHNAIKRRYIKNIKYDNIKCLYNFLFDINLNKNNHHIDISKITYNRFNFYYQLYYNNTYYCTICIIDKSYNNIKEQHFWFYDKSYNHYLIYMELEYHNNLNINLLDEEQRGHHDSGVEYEDTLYGLNDARMLHYYNNVELYEDEEADLVLSDDDYFNDYMFIRDIMALSDKKPYTKTELMDKFCERIENLFN